MNMSPQEKYEVSLSMSRSNPHKVPPASLPEASDTVSLFGRDPRTCSLQLARADTPEGAAELRAFCRRRRQEGAVALNIKLRKQSGRTS
jgi:hypothetical protein